MKFSQLLLLFSLCACFAFTSADIEGKRVKGVKFGPKTTAMMQGVNIPGLKMNKKGFWMANRSVAIDVENSGSGLVSVTFRPIRADISAFTQKKFGNVTVYCDPCNNGCDPQADVKSKKTTYYCTSCEGKACTAAVEVEADDLVEMIEM